jgi:hypothetical protein
MSANQAVQAHKPPRKSLPRLIKDDPTLLGQPESWARRALLLAYLGLMATMVAVAWEVARIDLSNAGKIFGALAAGVLGAVINPVGSKKAQAKAAASASQPQAKQTAVPAPTAAPESAPAPAAPAPVVDWAWAAQTLIGCAALLATAAALVFDGGRHVNAPDAFVAVAAAFGTLFLDTSGATHALTPAAGDKA